MENLFLCVIVAFIYCSLFCSATVEVLRPRGVSLSKKIFYSPAQDFNCIDGSSKIPYSFVNDDYCDCEDGSDEPGTSACSNSFFHCINSGYVSLNIPSSRVNDNICDCCDGGDEYNSSIQCPNTCLEMGRQAREELQKQQQLFEMGYGLWQKYSTDGKQLKENSKSQLEDFKKSEAELERIMKEKEALKNEIEEKEKAVLEVYKSLKEDQQKKQEEEEKRLNEEEDRKNAEDAFHDLDLDNNGILTFQEIQQFPKFDSNQDGEVSEEEAKFYLQSKESTELEEFITTGWMVAKPIYMLDKIPVTESSADKEDQREMEDQGPPDIPEESDDETYNPEDDAHLDDDLLEDEELQRPPEFPAKEDTSEHEKTTEPQYDAETQKLVDAATEARKEFQTAVDELEKLKDEMKQHQSFIDADFGRAEEFATLKGQCFDFDDREYTYKLCPFDRASQVAKSGGGDVSLGRWGSWIGPEDNKYSKMRYENGQTCWNGPARSVTVLLQCGLENRLLSSSEPNRCEYLFEFTTPALCSQEPDISHHQHTEL